MNRWLMIGSMVGLLSLSTGCLHHNTRSSCGSCNTSCGDSSGNSCGSCNDGGGLLGKLGGKHCRGCGRPGCVAGPLCWQQGGLDYSSHLPSSQCGLGGNGACGNGSCPGYTQNMNPGLLGHNAAQQIQSQPFTPGPPSAQVAYPYYTHRGPRDFLLDNPPSIGR